MSEETTVNPQQQELAALERIAMTHDGLLLHRYLTRVMETMPLDTSHGALAADLGRRSLARDLRAAMAQGIESNRVRTNTDQPLVARPGKSSSGRARGVGRRVSLVPGDGWAEPSDTGGDAA